MLGGAAGLGAPLPSPEAIGAFLPPTPSTSSLEERGRGRLPGPSLWPKLLFDLCLPSASRIMIPWSKVKPRDRQWASCPGAWQPSPVPVVGVTLVFSPQICHFLILCHSLAHLGTSLSLPLRSQVSVFCL